MSEHSQESIKLICVSGEAILRIRFHILGKNALPIINADE